MKEKLSAADRVRKARDPKRPVTGEYVEALIRGFQPLAGDRLFGEDPSVLGGIGWFHDMPVTVIGHQKGRSLEENVKYRFGMPDPEGYRKAVRLMKQAEKFGRPVITFVDTPGAYPGMDAEERGQGEAIARSILTMSRLRVPSVAVFIGEGGSGGALALGAADRVIMLENSIYSILSPEGFASILWKDAGRWEEAAEVMKLTAGDLEELGICDLVIPEDGDRGQLFDRVDRGIRRELRPLIGMSGEALVKERYRRFRRFGGKRQKG
ncbi:acetyl-CoA carboxylase carboxyl transferase subunit alpha [Eubacterium pyruvativorans]|uniref:acetyl-CoA carboxylase carboxyl transferase subunit alpha n=1 Tax=Eubacterium pyruvativorans TaxID=155865 RepID=UPI00088A4CFD|nr:acetyl-CoA carboxylase carboxyl transferase subunit alpha [Eubacterium pyruvativorans]SDF27678.1 acetyl-CoA carboxylase carboxyl transferase subunit alpha [Eubacterium pyruvativorans]